MKIVVIGGGGVGRHLAAALTADAEVVVVDRDPANLADIEEGVDALTLRGDATHRSTLRQAEVHKADLVVAVTGSDTVNVTAASLASDMGALRSVARVDDPGFYDTKAAYESQVLGVHALLCASRLVAAELLRMLTGSDCRHTFSMVGGALHGAVVEVPADSPAIGLAPQKLRTDGAETVRAVIRGARVRAAADVSVVDEGDALLLLGPPINVARVVHYVHERDASRAVLIGGGDIGGQLATSLSQFEADVRVIEVDRNRCESLASELPHVRILHGDGTNIAFLRDERVGESASMCAVTRSDEVNLMASLLGRELGVRRTFALVHRPGYASVYDHLGIHGTTSAHEVMARTLRWLLPGRRVLGRSALPGTDHEVIELRVPTLGKRHLTARDLPLPPGTLVLSVARDSGELLRTDSEVVGGEHVLVAGRAGSQRELERALSRLAREGSG
ncbi:MAG: Trk system potassium transporter TrkA [Myxococcota bacterium]